MHVKMPASSTCTRGEQQFHLSHHLFMRDELASIGGSDSFLDGGEEARFLFDAACYQSLDNGFFVRALVLGNSGELLFFFRRQVDVHKRNARSSRSLCQSTRRTPPADPGTRPNAAGMGH